MNRIRRAAQLLDEGVPLTEAVNQAIAEEKRTPKTHHGHRLVGVLSYVGLFMLAVTRKKGRH